MRLVTRGTELPRSVGRLRRGFSLAWLVGCSCSRVCRRMRCQLPLLLIAAAVHDRSIASCACAVRPAAGRCALHRPVAGKAHAVDVDVEKSDGKESTVDTAIR